MGAVRLPKPIHRATGSVLHMDAVAAFKRVATEGLGAVISDPPFFIGIGRADHWKTGQLGNDPWTADTVSTHRAAAEFYKPIAEEAMRTLRPGGSTIIMGGSQSIAAWEDAAAAVGLRWMAEITVLWNTGKPRRHNFGSLSMPIKWHIKPGGRHAWETDQKSIWSNVLVCQKVPLPERHHPAQKPVELTNFLISLLTRPDDTVFDPFCGSGSTLVSAAMCERSWVGSDIERDNCDIALQRAHDLDEEESRLRPIYLWANGRLEEV